MNNPLRLQGKLFMSAEISYSPFLPSVLQLHTFIAPPVNICVVWSP